MPVVARGGKKNRKHGRNKRRDLRTGRSRRNQVAGRDRKIRNLMRVNGLTRALATVVWDGNEATPPMASEVRELRAKLRYLREQRSLAKYGPKPKGGW